MKKIRICVIGTRGFPHIQGGVEKHCESLYPIFSDKYEFLVFRRKPYVNTTPNYNNIRFIDLPSTKIKGIETVLHSFIATIYTLFCSPDIVHIHNIGPAMFAVILRIFKKKIVLTYHSANYEHDKWGIIAKTILRICEYIALKSAHAIIFVNKFQMMKYSDKTKAKSCYIPNGVPEVTPTNSTQYLRSIDIEPQKYIIAIGRITPEKGFKTLIQAFTKLNTEYKLVIAGGVETESSYYSELKQISPQGKIIFTGYIYGEQLNEIYSHAKLYVLSSYNEGFPLVLLEAMKYKLEVLVSDIPATHLIELHKENYFKVGDVEDLHRKLDEKLKIDKKINIEYNLHDFNWKEIVAKTENIYNMIL